MPRLEISLLGKMAVRLHSAANVRWFPGLETGKASVLLAYLAVHRSQAHSRLDLAAMLWPQRSDTEALNSLRFSLAKLRTELNEQQSPQPFWLVDKTQVQWNPQTDMWVDVFAFEQAAATCEAKQAKVILPSEQIRAALALYHGDFLHGLKLGVSITYETWALEKRDQLARQRLRLFKLLAQSLTAEGERTEAQETCRLILAEHPWDEETHCHLMQLLAASGQRGAALAQYEACRQKLSELGMEPERATCLLANQIKNGPNIYPSEQKTPLVARRRELERLIAYLDRTLAGQGQIALISGEAGSGKTALMREFSRQALTAHPDLLAVGGQCDAYAGIGQPYQPFVEALQMLAGDWRDLHWAERLLVQEGQRLQRALPKASQLLVQAAPALLNRFVDREQLMQRLQALTDSGETPGLRPKPDWLRALNQLRSLEKLSAVSAPPLDENLLFEQLARFLSEFGRQVPLLLLLDDLHWADPGSAALLFHLARRLTSSRILILAAYRPGEIISNSAHPFAKSLLEIRRYGGNLTLDLDHTAEGRSDAQAFVSAWLAEDPHLQPNRLDESFQRALAQRTGGNPLFTIELLRNLQERGELSRSAAGDWVARLDLDWSALPERVEAAIAEQINHLPPQWQDWLATASVEGESFTAEALAQFHGVSEKQILQALNGPLNTRQGALRLVLGEGLHWAHLPDGQLRPLSRYRFRHILFQKYLYQRLDPVDRSRRHAALGAALENLYTGDDQELAQHAAELARHFEAGGLQLEAAAYALRAGQQAVYRASNQVAVTHYRHGLALLADLPQTPERSRLEARLYLGLGAPFMIADHWGGTERQQAIEQALQRIQELDAQSDRLEFLAVLFNRADWLNSQGEHSQAARLGEKMLALSEDQPGPAWLMAHRTLGQAHLLQGHFAQACQHFENTFQVYHAIGRAQVPPAAAPDLGTIGWAVFGFALAAAGYLDRGWQQAEQAIALARSRPLPILGSVLIFASEIAIWRDDLPQLQALSSELNNLGESESMRYFHAYGLGNQGYARLLAAAQAEGAASQELAQAGLEEIQLGWQLWQTAGVRPGRGQWLLRQAQADLQTGRIAEGLNRIQQALKASDAKGIEIALAGLYRLQGEFFLRLEPPRQIEAQASFQQSLEIARQQGARLFELKSAISLARLWQLERAEEAAKLLQAACAGFTEGFESPVWKEAQTLLDRLS